MAFSAHQAEATPLLIRLQGMPAPNATLRPPVEPQGLAPTEEATEAAAATK